MTKVVLVVCIKNYYDPDAQTQFLDNTIPSDKFYSKDRMSSSEKLSPFQCRTYDMLKEESTTCKQRDAVFQGGEQCLKSRKYLWH
ncbi:hypothetical protein CEXT_557071 [Caerostris extrusa]|uniref:Uncharacterized protein n=1 Tax=Caerostris extrusa TaxID=172846 RepID=A0AAV4MPA1_CAEEX|nr:hypothetical protein CEXT_557071 [Caerostris extrusa]